MERMWRKVNQGLTNRSSSKTINTIAIQSTDTASSAGFGDPQIVVAVAGTNTTTGRRLAASGQSVKNSDHKKGNALSQHVINTASSERRRRRRRKSRPRKNSERPSGTRNDLSQPPTILPGIIPPSSTVGGVVASISGECDTTNEQQPPPLPAANADPTLRQRAVAKLRLFNFHLNWDLHMTQCKPCGPRSSGNILTRRLCRNRRREDNELYRSNSFKFERFERKEVGNINDIGIDTLQKQVSTNYNNKKNIIFLKEKKT